MKVRQLSLIDLSEIPTKEEAPKRYPVDPEIVEKLPELCGNKLSRRKQPVMVPTKKPAFVHPVQRKIVPVPNYERRIQRISSIMRRLYELPEESLRLLKYLTVHEHCGYSHVGMPMVKISYSKANTGNMISSLYYDPSGLLIADYTPAEGIIIADGFPKSPDDQIFVNPTVHVSESKLRFLEALPSYVENKRKEYQNKE